MRDADQIIIDRRRDHVPVKITGLRPAPKITPNEIWPELNINGFSSMTINSVSVSTQVVVLLKRLANAVGAFGISNQYLLHRQAKAEEQWSKGADDFTTGAIPHTRVTWHSLAGLKDVEWPSWPSRSDWRRARNIIVNRWTVQTEGLLRGLSSMPLTSLTST